MMQDMWLEVFKKLLKRFTHVKSTKEKKKKKRKKSASLEKAFIPESLA